MKKIIFFIAITLVTISCKNSEEKTEEKSTDTVSTNETIDPSEVFYKGDFIYIADAAVLKGVNYIYGVTLDEMAEELAKQVEPAKESDYDMVYVVVKGDVSQKPEGQEGWDKIITIKEIIFVSDTPSKVDIKIEESKE